MSQQPLLTKSAFASALECVSKLYYRRNREMYADGSINDPFLQALADGGFQVGELAKYLFCENPYDPDITVRTLDPLDAVKSTEERLQVPGRVVIAEAAFRHESLFVRTDLLVKEASVVRLYEVKSKSISTENEQLERAGPTPGIRSEWQPYLYDVAFQKFVVSRALAGRGLIARAYLVLVDRDRRSTVHGLNQLFKIQKYGNGRTRISVTPGTTKTHLGADILRVVDVDSIVDRIWNEYPIPSDLGEVQSFEGFVRFCADSLAENKRIFAPIGKKCKGCQYRVATESLGGKRSGFEECWHEATRLDQDLLRGDLVLDLWGVGTGRRSVVQEQIDKGVFLLAKVDPGEFVDSDASSSPDAGMTANQRRIEQVRRVQKGTTDSYLDRDGLAAEMDSWEYPLHMIDFETSCTALPFYKGLHPYDGVAFQFSHHTMDKDGTIRHAGQFLSFEPGVFPNYDFVRALKKELATTKGTIFRYHNHENTYLNLIYRQLELDPDPPDDKADMQAFIRQITTWKEDHAGKEHKAEGPRAMVDLYQLVRRYYYPPASRGSISIKAILPCLIADSEHVRRKYSSPVYGIGKPISSLNVDEHVWIQERFGNDPYRTLKPLFEGYDDDQLDALVRDFDEIADGGAAMTAYNYLQFSDVPVDQREELKQGLLRYCELDTMAMIMIVEGWREMIAS